MSRVSSGEIKRNPITGYMHVYPGIPNNNDDLIDEDLEPGDENQVISNKMGVLSDKARYYASALEKQLKLAEKYAKYSSLAKLTLKKQMEISNKAIEPIAQLSDKLATGVGNYADAKPSNILGINPFVRAIPTVLGIGAGINQLAYYKRQNVKQPNTYVPSNTQAELNTLASLKDNPYTKIRGMYDAERRYVNEGNRIGGLSGSLKYLGNIAARIGMLKNIADAIQNSQMNRNTLAAQWANASINAKVSDAQRAQNALLFDRNDYITAHGKKVKGIETGIANILNPILSGYQNEFKYLMGNRTLDLYQQEVDNKKAELLRNYRDIHPGENINYGLWNIPDEVFRQYFHMPFNPYRRRTS